MYPRAESLCALCFKSGLSNYAGVPGLGTLVDDILRLRVSPGGGAIGSVSQVASFCRGFQQLRCAPRRWPGRRSVSGCIPGWRWNWWAALKGTHVPFAGQLKGDPTSIGPGPSDSWKAALAGSVNNGRYLVVWGADDWVDSDVLGRSVAPYGAHLPLVVGSY